MCYDGGMMRCRTYAILAAMLTVMFAAGLGCGPAAPAGQGGATGDAVAVAATSTPIPPLPSQPATTDDSGWDGLGEPPPTPTFTPMELQYPVLSGYFIDAIRRYEAAAAAAEGSGATASGQPAPTPYVMNLIIIIDAHDHVDQVQRFLEESGASQIRCLKFPSDYIVPGECAAAVPVSLLRGLAEQPGIAGIEIEPTIEPAG